MLLRPPYSPLPSLKRIVSFSHLLCRSEKEKVEQILKRFFALLLLEAEECPELGRDLPEVM